MQLQFNGVLYRRIIVELTPETREFLWSVVGDIEKGSLRASGRHFDSLLGISSQISLDAVSVSLVRTTEV